MMNVQQASDYVGQFLRMNPSAKCPVGCEQAGDRAEEAGEILVAAEFYRSGAGYCGGHGRANRMDEHAQILRERAAAPRP